jgi:hypothetical protein
MTSRTLLPLCVLFAAACGGKNDDTGNGDSGSTETPTYYQDIAPLLSENCGTCHTAGGIQPDILFDDAETVQGLSTLIADAVTEGRMPPFYAAESDQCENPWGFSNDARLDADTVALFQAWATAGGPIGDEATAVEVPPPPVHGLDNPDAIYTPETPWTTSVAGNTEDEFVCFTLDLGLTEDAYLTAFEVIPEDLSVVHHVLVGVDVSGDSAALAGDDGIYECFGGFGIDATFIGGWVPSAEPIRAPQHSGFRVPAGSRLLLQMHYHLLDEQRSDATSLAVVFAEQTPVREAMVSLLGNAAEAYTDGSGLQSGENDEGGLEFRIPADESDHTETMYFDLFSSMTRPLEVFLTANHMHYVGTDMRQWVERGTNAPDPDDACLLHTPNWDFDWQQFYFYDVDADNAPTIYPGDKLWLECTYNNTLDNPGLRQALEENGLDEPIDVYLGEGTLDEMCIAIYGLILEVEFEAEDETHEGAVDGTVTAVGFDAACEGPASLSLTDDSLTGVVRCGLDVLGSIFTFEMDLTGNIVDGVISGTATYGVVGLSDTIDLALSGTTDGDAVSLQSAGSGTIDGYAIDLNLSVAAAASE